MEREINIRPLAPIYPSHQFRTFREVIDGSARRYGDQAAFILKHGHGRHAAPDYERVSYLRFQDEVNWVGTGLKLRGLEGKRLAIIGNNSYEWALSYFSILCGLGIAVPLDKGLPYEETLSSVERAGVDVFIFDKHHIEDVEKLKEEAPGITLFISMDGEAEGYVSLADIREEGQRAFEAGDHSYLDLTTDPDELAVLLFTSGTTSRAKAVMMSEHNILFDCHTMASVTNIHRGDVNMAFLPYHHTYGQSGQVMYYSLGCTTVYCDGLRYIQKNIAEYHVTVFIGVPLLIEAIYKKLVKTIQKQGKLKQFRRGLRLSSMLMKVGIDRRRKIFKEIHDQFGGELRAMYSGASALDPKAVTGLTALGFEVYQGYGLTEHSPVVTTENVDEHQLGSIGKPLPGVRAKLIHVNDEGIGELICKSPARMMGYYEDEENTRKAIDEYGWLHTGDLARVDERGFIFITGRAKNVIVLKNGKNVYPEELEILIDALPYVKENIVIGQPRRLNGDHKDLALCAKIVYDPQAFPGKSQDEIYAAIKTDLDKINQDLPSYKQILRLKISDQEMKKTTTGKVKRFEEGAAPNA